MNFDLLAGLPAVGDKPAIGETTLRQEDATLFAAFAQLLGERFAPEETQSGELTQAEPQNGLANTHAHLEAEQQKTDEAPLAPIPVLQALFAMLPALSQPRPIASAAIVEQNPPEATQLPNILSDHPRELAPNPVQPQATVNVADKNPLVIKPDQSPLPSDKPAERATPPAKFSAELTQPTPTITHTSPAVVPNLFAAPTAAHAPPTPQLHAPLGSPEWQQALGQQVLMFQRNGQQNAELRLHPQELGALQITLTLDEQQAQLHIVSPHSQVRSAVEAALPQLRQAFAESGIQLGQSSVGGESLPQPQHSPSQTPYRGRQNTAHPQRSSTEASLLRVDTPTDLLAMARAIDGVDIFA